MSFAAKIGLPVVVLGLVAVSQGCRRSAGPGETGEDSPPVPVLAKYLGLTLGSPDGEIVIDTILPVTNGCQDDIGIYVAKLAEMYPQTFRVRIYDMRAVDGKAVLRLNGIKCAAVLVNGTTRFDVGGDEGKLLLEGPMDPLDLYSVLVWLVAKSDTPDLKLPQPVITCAPDQEQRRKAGF